MNTALLDIADKCRVNLHHVDVSGRRAGRDDREGRGEAPCSALTPLRPSSCACACGEPHLLLPHWGSFQGPRKGEVPLVDCAVVS